MHGSDVERAFVLSHDLKQVLVPWKESAEFLCPRHRVIARQVIGDTAPVAAKLYAVTTFLAQISADVTPHAIARRTPEYFAYRGIINFDNVRFMCGEDL
jgi:hypothetical protein